MASPNHSMYRNRRERLQSLVARAGGVHAFCHKNGLYVGYITRILDGELPMRANYASKLAKACGLPQLYFRPTPDQEN